MTHIKNAAAFAKLVDYCTGYGGTYNPGRPTLQIGSLINQLQQANVALTNVITCKSAFDNEVNKRKQAFNKLPRLVSSILRTLEASGASKEKLADARTFVQQVLGTSPKRRTVPVVEVNAQTPNVASSRGANLQMAYVSRLDSFTKLIQAVATEPLYQPNESMLTVNSLVVLANELHQFNVQVSAARVVWSNAIINRNKILYYQSQSVKETGSAVKRYVRAIFGHDSEQYAQVKVLNFGLTR